MICKVCGDNDWYYWKTVRTCARCGAMVPYGEDQPETAVEELGCAELYELAIEVMDNLLLPVDDVPF